MKLLPLSQTLHAKHLIHYKKEKKKDY